MKKCVEGFTLLEMMVGLVILAIGILGFSGMTIMMSKGNRAAKKLDEASTLVQSSIENMSAVNWNLLGTNTSLPAPNGLDDGIVRPDLSPLNRNGQQIGTGTGPYIYYRHVVVCEQLDATSALPGPDPTKWRYCGSNLNGPYRPPELACNGIGLSNREKMVRVLINWTDSTGKCHFREMDHLAFQ